MLLVYTHQITPRLKYIFKQICTRILGIPISFTKSIEEFESHNGLKMTYSIQPIGDEVFVRSHNLLFEQGLSDLDINVHEWEDTKCFFYNGDKSSIPFDIFSASFYLLSRYEEYLPHVRDEFGRFTAKESLALKHDFLHQPVVDIWAYKFQKILKANFPEFNFPERAFRVMPVIDVPMAFFIKQKGLMRTIGGVLNDLIRFKFKGLYLRMLVLLGFKQDPYDTFDWIINKQKKYHEKFKIFFLIGDYSTFDKNISINKKAFVALIKSVADYCKVGLKASYFALEDYDILKREKKNMESIINTTLELSRNSFSKLNLPHSYRNLVELEILEDYTMGYVNISGFRAGTCTPFFFYDMDYEIQTPLKINSYNMMDYVLLRHNSLLDKKGEMMKILNEVKQVNGTFVPVFHNYCFGEDERWKGYKELFTIVLKTAHEA